MRTLRLVREDEDERRRVALELGYVGESCCECNEYTLEKENPDGDPVSPLLCNTCGNRQLPAPTDLDDSVHTEVPLPDGILGLDLPLPEREEEIRLYLRRWLREHLDGIRLVLIVGTAICLVLTAALAFRFVLNTSDDIFYLMFTFAGAIHCFTFWQMLEMVSARLWS